jgi:glyoxylase-like metal-dependent hydrolase (beta-lactamase superfamily II)
LLIEPGLHLVASGAAGFDLSDTYDCNAWAFVGELGTILFDAGAGRAPDAVLAAGRAGGLDWPQPVSLFLTHAHADHAGGAAALRERLAARVHAGPLTARWVAAGDEEAVSLPAARRAGVYPEDYRYAPCPVDRVVEDGDRLAFGDLEIVALATPGHSADHTAYLVTRAPRRWLVAGDCLFHGGKVVWQDTWDCDVQATAASLRKLADVPFDALLPGHLAFSLNGATRHLQAALERLDRLLLPLSLA